MSEQSRVSYLTLAEALQDIFIHQRTGALSLIVDEGLQRLFFFSGQLYLSADNPLRQRMEILLAGPVDVDQNPRFDPRKYLEQELEQFVRDLGDRIAEWSSQDLRFEGSFDEVPDDLVGPVPTGALVMDLGSRRYDDPQLLQRLGGLDARYRSSEEVMLRRRVPELDAAEMQLLDRLGQAATVRTLIAESGGLSSAVLSHLARLAAVRLVVVVPEREATTSPLSRELLEDISRRVVASLEEQPVALSEAALRARLGKLLQDYGKQTYFELLEVDSGSSADEIHRHFMERARIAHPSQAARLRMKDRGRRLEWLFARLTEAYLVLSDPDRSAHYRQSMAEVPIPKVPLPRDKVRRSEQMRLARESYLLASEHIEHEDYHFAIELLRQAVLADPLPEYYQLLGQCLKRNPRWLHMAVDSLREAASLRPHDAELRRDLAETTREYQRRRDSSESGESGQVEEQSAASQGLAQRLMKRLKGEGDADPE